jgi:hypothetical protein
MLDPTVPSSPAPQTATVVAAIVRIIMMGLGAYGFHPSGDPAAIAAAISLLIGAGWEIYEQWRQAHVRHESVMATYRMARPIQKKDYKIK